MCHIQENIIFHFTHAIFNKKFFSKYTDFHMKEHKIYDKLLDKTSLETKLSVLGPFSKDEPAPVPISHICILLIQNNPLHSLFLISLYLIALTTYILN